MSQTVCFIGSSAPSQRPPYPVKLRCSSSRRTLMGSSAPLNACHLRRIDLIENYLNFRMFANCGNVPWLMVVVELNDNKCRKFLVFTIA
ncbi:hypothetical protein H5410_043882 [Solanum commersonii]|uniref:Uncharacterized protein n=1 Tax=Solanum commersonii TaxID=4109 RepID=A0A9J5Y1H2_SOLCO|nr:hypothetical protein H5410_043882 [Solanum commersonii]